MDDDVADIRFVEQAGFDRFADIVGPPDRQGGIDMDFQPDVDGASMVARLEGANTHHVRKRFGELEERPLADEGWRGAHQQPDALPAQQDPGASDPQADRKREPRVERWGGSVFGPQEPDQRSDSEEHVVARIDSERPHGRLASVCTSGQAHQREFQTGLEREEGGERPLEVEGTPVDERADRALDHLRGKDADQHGDDQGGDRLRTLVAERVGIVGWFGADVQSPQEGDRGENVGGAVHHLSERELAPRAAVRPQEESREDRA